MYNSMQDSSGGTASNSAAQRPVVPRNPAGSMHDYGSGARTATAASAGYGTMDPNFNNNNPYIGNNGSVVENMKGFECSDLEISLLTGPRANTANPPGSMTMPNTAASYRMHPQQNNPASSVGNMQQQQYSTNSSYGMMQTSSVQSGSQNFDFNNSSQTPMAAVGTQQTQQMFTNSSNYTKQQQMNAAVASDPSLTNSRRLSTPVMSSNQSQSYLQRSNSYPANSNFEDGNFPSSGRNYQGQNFNPNLPNSQSMRNRSYSTGYAQDGFAASNAGSWTDSGYGMQSKNTFGGIVGANGVRNMYRPTNSGMSNPQLAGGMRGMRYPTQRGAYSGTNSEMTGNNYGNNSMQSPPNFHSNKMMSMNYSDRNAAMGHQNTTMVYSQSMNQMQNAAGSSQKLRHYGPMPNTRLSNSVGQRMPFTSSTSQGARAMSSQYPNSQYGNQGSMDSYSGAYQGNMSRYPGHSQMTARRTMTSNVAGQPGAGMAELSNIAACENFYNRTSSKPDAFSQDPGSEMYKPQFANSQSQFDPLSGASAIAGSSYQQPVDNPISATEARKNMIFSAELEKLARLSRNPMLEADFNVPGHDESSMNMTPAQMVPTAAANQAQQMSSYNQGTHQNQTMSQNSMPPCSVMQQQPSSGGNVPSQVPNVYNAKMPGTPVTPSQPAIPPNSKPMPMEQGYISPANSAPPTPIVSQNQNIHRATPERTTASSAPATPATSQDTTRQTNSADAVINTSAASPLVGDIKNKMPDIKKEEASPEIEKLTQSVKEKQDEITKANPNHHEYLSDNNVPAGQNCIAALSAACCNMIADMDSTMPKQSRGTAQSPLGNKSGDEMTLPPMRAPSVPGSVVSGGHLTPSSDVSMPSVGMSGQASTPLPMHMDNFSSPPSNFGNMAGSDYQTQYHDFLDQSVPMHPNSKQLVEKVRKPRKRRKSEDIMDTGVNQSGVKKRKPRKKSQNPSSVESLETAQSLDNISECTTLSDSHGQFVDDNCRSASQTPTSVPTSWGVNNPRVSSADMTCLGAIPGQLHQSQIMDTDQSTQDFLDSVFSPDTTMSNMIMQDVADSVMMGHIHPNRQSPTSSYASHHSNDNASVASYQSQSSLPTPTSQNHSLTNLDQSQVHAPVSNGPKMLSGHPNNMVSSSGDLVAGSVSTSGDRIETSSDKSNSAGEAHPLEILQAQIQLQRQQFNLSDSRPIPLRDSGVKKAAGANTARKTGATGEVDVDTLMAEENSTWYVPNEQPKEPEVPWEQTRKTASCKGQGGNEAINQTDRRKQNTQHEKNRRDTLKNSIENLKNALPDGTTLNDQTQQSVLLKAHNYIVDMLEKQQKNKVCKEEIGSLKVCNNSLEDDIAMFKQEYEMLSNFE